MSIPTVVVFTANSNTGFAVCEILLAKYSGRVHIRAVVRKTSNAGELRALGAGIDIITGDIAKPQCLRPVFEGADTAFFATPRAENRGELGRMFVDACVRHGCAHGIFISIVGADHEETTYQRQFREIEVYAESMAGKPVTLPVGDRGKVVFSFTSLRCGLFYQNMYGSLAGFKQGVLYFPLREGNLCHVDYQDISECAAAILVDSAPHANKVYNIIGQYQSGGQIAGAITRKANIPCRYEDVDDETAEYAFCVLGLQPWIARCTVEQVAWFRDGNGAGIPSDISRILRRPPTSFADFVLHSIRPMLV